MSVDDKNVGGTPGAQTLLDRDGFAYSDDALKAIEWSFRVEAISSPSQIGYEQLFSGLDYVIREFLSARTRKDEFEVQRARLKRHEGIVDAADNLLSALSASNWDADLELRSRLVELSGAHRALAQQYRDTTPSNASKPDRAYFLHQLCSHWQFVSGQSPTVAFRHKTAGNYIVGEKYGRAVEFLIAAGSEPAVHKGQKPITHDIAAQAINSFNDPVVREQMDAELSLQRFADWIDPLVHSVGK